MIICKTPLRVSFFGGGTDFPEYFSADGGAVLGTAVDKFIHHTLTRFPSRLFDYSIRLAYSKVECVKSLAEIEHRPFREILKQFGIENDIEIGLTADLPAFSGLGSSSSFTVGLINALSAFQGRFIPQQELAQRAIEIERERLGETVGCQDQVFAAYGGLNLIEFRGACDFVVNRLTLPKSRLNELDRSLMLVYTGIRRSAGELERKKLTNLTINRSRLLRIRKIVDEAHALLTGTGPLDDFGRLLSETWNEKRELDAGVSPPRVEQMYDLAMQAGALGGKLLGAGGGGFMLFFVPEERQADVRRVLAEFFEVPFSINAPGSCIVHS